MRLFGMIAVCIILLIDCSHAGEENDLWLLLSSYEDIGITTKDLAFFLATQGYNAKPNESYVTVKLASGKEVYLTPNGAAPKIADIWMNPPKNQSGLVQVIPVDAVKSNVIYNRTSDLDFVKAINKCTIFPVSPLGMCYDGSQMLNDLYKSFGYNTEYLYDPNGFNSQGHLWVAVEDKAHPDTWLAVDSYYGTMMDGYYYKAPYSFVDFRYLDSINPKWKVA
ncbi:MAG: hypothetical protein ACE14P_00275 [Methanotrichaceae archaeon]